MVTFSGGEIVGQLDESESAVKTLPLLLEAPARRTAAAALLVLLLLFFTFIRWQEVQRILLLLVLHSGLTQSLSFPRRRGRSLFPHLPVSDKTSTKQGYDYR